MALAFALFIVAIPFGARSAETPPVGCSWPAKIDADTLNFAYPDESATYWVTRFVSIPGAHLEIRGTYPDARYLSFHAYDELQRPVGSLADYEIAPDAGSLNPFVTPGTAPGGTFTAHVAFTAKPESPAPNTLYAGATADGFMTLVISDPVDEPSDAALAAHQANWIPWGGVFYDGLVIYRHMLPATSFAQAIQNVPEGADAASIMGDHFPRSGYCTPAAFESDGPAACVV